MKRYFIVIVCLVLITCLASTAFAVNRADKACEEIQYRETSAVDFLLDNNGKIAGALKPNEKQNKLNFQSNYKKAPIGLEDGMAIRRHAYIRVELDDEMMVLAGGTRLDVTITLTNLELVEQVLGEEASNEAIIDATIYCPNLTCANNYAAHIFLGQNSNRIQVGSVSFANGRCLALYVGDFYGDGCLVLGFRAKPVEPEPECNVCECPEQPVCGTPCKPQCPVQPTCPTQTPCTPCTPTCVQPQVSVTTSTTTVVTTTTTTTTTTSFGQGGCR